MCHCAKVLTTLSDYSDYNDLAAPWINFSVLIHETTPYHFIEIFFLFKIKPNILILLCPNLWNWNSKTTATSFFVCFLLYVFLSSFSDTCLTLSMRFSASQTSTAPYGLDTNNDHKIKMKRAEAPVGKI